MMTELKNSLKLIKDKNSLVNYVYDYVIKKFPAKYTFKTKNQKYDLRIIISEILYFLVSGVSYANYRGPINNKTLNRHIIFFTRNNIFKDIYDSLFNEYIKNKAHTKLKYQYTDTSFIINKNGKQKLGRNKFCKNKKCYKLSLIVDINGIPNSSLIRSGNKNDAKIAINNILLHKNSMKRANSKIKPYMLADKMYDTKEFRDICKQNNYKPIVDYNKRNIKNKKLIKVLQKKEKKIYKKRTKVENTFCLLKKYKRLQIIYDSYLSTYITFLNIALCLMILKYL